MLYRCRISKGRKERDERNGIPTPVGDNQTPIPKGHRVKASSRTIQIGVKPAVARVKTKAPKTIYKTFVNKRNGTISKVPAGVDPSFNFNQGNYSRDLVLFDDFMRKAKKTFPERFENIAETILRNEIKKNKLKVLLRKLLQLKITQRI